MEVTAPICSIYTLIWMEFAFFYLSVVCSTVNLNFFMFCVNTMLTSRYTTVATFYHLISPLMATLSALNFHYANPIHLSIISTTPTKAIPTHIPKTNCLLFFIMCYLTISSFNNTGRDLHPTWQIYPSSHATSDATAPRANCVYLFRHCIICVFPQRQINR